MSIFRRPPPLPAFDLTPAGAFRMIRQPPEPPPADPDAQKRAEIAVRLLWSVQPSDRALTGWRDTSCAHAACGEGGRVWGT